LILLIDLFPALPATPFFGLVDSFGSGKRAVQRRSPHGAVIIMLVAVAVLQERDLD
jgi:hypothetical protein